MGDTAEVLVYTWKWRNVNVKHTQTLVDESLIYAVSDFLRQRLKVVMKQESREMQWNRILVARSEVTPEPLGSSRCGRQRSLYGL